jgi:hypothetical protein
MTQDELLTRLEADTRELLEQVRTRIAPLDPAELQYRKSTESWNILECFAHLNAFSDVYLSRIELAIHKSKARSWSPDGEVRYTGRGRRALRRADPTNPKRYRTRKRYDFSHQPLGPETVKAFIINAEMLLRLLRAARAVDLNRARIRKAHAWTGSYRLGNLLEWLVRHAQRHVRQAEKVREPGY